MLYTGEGSGDLLFLTWLHPDGSDCLSMTDAYEQVADFLKSRDVVLLNERIFGEVGAAAAALSTRRQVLAEEHGASHLRPTYLEGRPCCGRGVAGIQIIAARVPGPEGASFLGWDNRVCGRLIRGPNAEYLMMSDVGQLLGGSRLSPTEETRQTLELVEKVLHHQAWSFTDVYRTWFYLHDILDWYREFNGVRNDAFRRLGLFDHPLGVIPASTGIQGRGVRENWCTLDLLGIRPLDGHGFKVRRLINPQQNEAPEYGSAFSRGLEIAIDDCRYLFISGTASINTEGRSVHPEDFERQTKLTLETVAALLASAGAGLEDICQATAFLKRPEDYTEFRRIIRSMGLEDLPMVCTIADVCRDELLFEIDATAIRSTTCRPCQTKGFGHESGPLR